VIQVTPHLRIFVAREPLDFRTRIDGTAAACKKVLDLDPMSGALFVFRNRAATMIRVLVYDGQGYWYMTKRLSSGRFRYWCDSGTEPSVRIASHQLQTLAAAGNWTQVTAAETWRSVER
jgi:transposase